GRLLLPQANDRHVLAAALACVADALVTFNTRDFPPDTLRPFGVAAVEPDRFVVQLLERSLVVVTAAEHRTSLTRPSLSVTEYLNAFRRNRLPATAAALAGERI